MALSFDSDHETPALRDGEVLPGKLAQGEYGARVGVPRLLRLLERHGAPASFFVPAVSALLHDGEVKSYVDDGHEVAPRTPWPSPAYQLQRDRVDRRAWRRARPARGGLARISPFDALNTPGTAADDEPGKALCHPLLTGHDCGRPLLNCLSPGASAMEAHRMLTVMSPRSP